MSIRKKLTIIISLLLMVSIGNSVFVYILENESETKLKWVSHTHEVILKSENLLLDLADAETGQRGYLLTSEPQYLQPYGRGVEAARLNYSKLKQLTSDNAIQQKRLEAIELVINDKLAELAETIALHDESPEKALEIVVSDRGKEYMDAIRRQMAEFQAEEKWLLEQRKANYAEARAYVNSAIIFQVIVIIILIVLLAMVIKQQLFEPLNNLILSIHSLRKGNKPEVKDFLQKDEMGFVVSSFYEMSEVVYKNQETLARQAQLDNLTGIRNRLNLEADIDKCLTKANSRNELVAICFIDLDNLKRLNDEFGHEVGDQLLLAFSERAVTSVRESDIVCRFGGDEFLIVLTGIHDEKALHLAVDKMCRKIKGQIHREGKILPIEFSTGVAIYPNNSNNAEELINHADIAMYYSKRQRKQDVIYFNEEMSARISDNG